MKNILPFVSICHSFCLVFVVGVASPLGNISTRKKMCRSHGKGGPSSLSLTISLWRKYDHATPNFKKNSAQILCAMGLHTRKYVCLKMWN